MNEWLREAAVAYSIPLTTHSGFKEKGALLEEVVAAAQDWRGRGKGVLTDEVPEAVRVAREMDEGVPAPAFPFLGAPPSNLQ